MKEVYCVKTGKKIQGKNLYVSFWDLDQNIRREVGDITKSSPDRTHYKLWVCFFGWELEDRGADAAHTTSAQHRLTNLRIILQS